MLDFPNSPAAGETYGNWQWDGEKWTIKPGSAAPVITLSAGQGITITPDPITTSGQISVTDGAYVPVTGGNMSGRLELNGEDPTQPNEAVSLAYCQEYSLYKTGGTMTGPLILSANPTDPLEAVTKAYADQMLPLAGGELTGDLVVDGALTVVDVTSLGAATASTPQTSDNSTAVATTAWVRAQGYSAGGSGGIPEAPNDGVTYGREDFVWSPVLPLSGGTLTGELKFASPGVISSDVLNLNATANVVINTACRIDSQGLVYSPHGYFNGGVDAGVVRSTDHIEVAPSVGDAQIRLMAQSEWRVTAAEGFVVRDETQGIDRLTIDSTGLVNAPWGFHAGVTATVPTPPTDDNGNNVATTAWVRAQAYSSGSYLPISGGTLTGSFRAPYIIAQDAGGTRYLMATASWLGFYNNAGNRIGYIGNSDTDMQVVCELAGSTFHISGPVTISSSRLLLHGRFPVIGLWDDTDNSLYGMWINQGELRFGLTDGNQIADSTLMTLNNVGNLSVKGTVNANGNQVIIRGAQPVLSLIDTDVSNSTAIWNNSGQIIFGAGDGAGMPSATWGYFNSSGLRVLGSVAVGSTGNTALFDDGNGHLESTTNLWLNGNTGAPITMGGDLNTQTHWIFTTTIQVSARVQCSWQVVPTSNNTGAVGDPSLAWGQMNCYWYVTTSARDQKQDIETAPPGALDKVNALRAVDFRWREQPILDGSDKRPEGPSGLHCGFVADEVAEVFGRDWGGYSCVEDEDGKKHEGIAYNELVATLWAAVQELSAKVIKLEERLADV